MPRISSSSLSEVLRDAGSPTLDILDGKLPCSLTESSEQLAPSLLCSPIGGAIVSKTPKSFSSLRLSERAF